MKRSLYRRLALLGILVFSLVGFSITGQEQPDYTGCGEPYYHVVETGREGDRIIAEVEYCRACTMCNEGEVCYEIGDCGVE
jgi:hypothetical protein